MLACTSALSFSRVAAFLRLHHTVTPISNRSRTPKETPTPRPILVPVERPDEVLVDDSDDDLVLDGAVLVEEDKGVEAESEVALLPCDWDEPKLVTITLALLRGTSASLAVVYARGSAASNVNDETVQQSVMIRGAMTRSFGAQQ
jgi:hypothetical protein